MAEEKNIQKAIQAVMSGYQTARAAKFSASHPVAIALQDAARLFEASAPLEKRRTMKVVASVGKGNWALVPWISLLVLLPQELGPVSPDLRDEVHELRVWRGREATA